MSHSDYRQGDHLELAPFAIEALRLTLAHLQTNQPKCIRKRKIAILSKALEIELPPELAVDWPTQHFSKLTFNSTTEKFNSP